MGVKKVSPRIVTKPAVRKVERVDESGGVHAMWSPSSANRWLNCPASVIESENLPQSKSSAAAIEGTLAHSYGEKVLLGDIELADIPDDEMRAGVEIYTEAVEAMYEEYGDSVGFEVEGKIDLNHLIPGTVPQHWSCFGSADFLCFHTEDTQIPTVVDFKYGRRLVEVEKNKQMLLYAKGVIDDLGIKSDVRLVIIQPRAAHKDGPVREWIAPAREVNEIGVSVTHVMSEANKKIIKKAGDWCTFCPLASGCDTKAQQIQSLAGAEFADEEFAPMVPSTMTNKQIALVIEHADSIRNWLGEVEAAAKLKLNKGKKIKGLKLVQSSGRRAWKDDKSFARLVKDLDLPHDEVYTQKPCGIGDMTAVLKTYYDEKPADLIAEYIVNNPGGVKVVSEDDGRIEYNPAKSEFADK